MERILQFGEGRFLRAFADYFIDVLNEKQLFDGKIVIVQPIEQGLVDIINEQKGRYTVLLRDMFVQEKRLIKCVSRGINPYTDFENFIESAKSPDLQLVISNTTEAGIAFLETDKLTDCPPASFPAKVTIMLYERYKHFTDFELNHYNRQVGDDTSNRAGDDASNRVGDDRSNRVGEDGGLIFIPCELIDASGDMLKEAVLKYVKHWGLDKDLDFVNWIHEANYFANTLVDRIVTGYPEDTESQDKLLVAAEPFHFFAIEAKGKAATKIKDILPFHKTDMNVIITDDVVPYKKRKVRILNGAHTMSVHAALLCGKETVGQMMEDPLFVSFLKQGVYEEIIPTLDLDLEDLKNFADSVLDRFRNPYIKHHLKEIAVNSKLKFETRILPSILEYHNRKNEWPEALTLAYASYMAYGGDVLSDNAGLNERMYGLLDEIKADGMATVLEKRYNGL